MKQATGNNSLKDTKIVSVRIDSGGHYFSVDTLPKAAFENSCNVEFSIVTHKTVLVPAEIFEPEAAASYLEIAGLGCAVGERPVYTVRGDKAVVMAIAESCADTLIDRFDSHIAFCSPLLEEFAGKEKALHIRTIGDVSYFKLYDGENLLFAEALMTDSRDETLYYTALLDRKFGLAAYLIYIYGDRQKQTAKLLKRYFKNIKCE